MSEPPYGDPQYPPPTWGWPPPGPYGGPYGPGPYAPGPYGPPPVLPPPRIAMRSDPLVGWLLAAVSALGVVAAYLTWYHAGIDGRPTFSGVDSAAIGSSVVKVIVVFNVLSTAMGLIIGVGRGDSWPAVVALVGSSVVLVFFVIHYLLTKIFTLFSVKTPHAAPGVYLAGLAYLAALVLAIVGTVRRHPARAA